MGVENCVEALRFDEYDNVRLDTRWEHDWWLGQLGLHHLYLLKAPPEDERARIGKSLGDEVFWVCTRDMMAHRV